MSFGPRLPAGMPFFPAPQSLLKIHALDPAPLLSHSRKRSQRKTGNAESRHFFGPTVELSPRVSKVLPAMKPEVALMNGLTRMLTPLLVMPLWGMLPPIRKR